MLFTNWSSELPASHWQSFNIVSVLWNIDLLWSIKMCSTQQKGLTNCYAPGTLLLRNVK